MSSLSQQSTQDHVLIDLSSPSAAFDVVVIGASAGGLVALTAILGELPLSLAAPIAVVLHLSPDRPSLLTEVLRRTTRLPVVWATDGETLERGTVYVAPPDRHLVFGSGGVVTLTKSPPVHFARPSVDLLFASAALAFGQRTLAVILSGNGFDGSAGVSEVHRRGGVVIAQDEASSMFFSMPREAIESGGVTFVLPLPEIGPAIRRLTALGLSPVVDNTPNAEA